MKKYLYLLATLLLTAVPFMLTSCDDDDNDGSCNLMFDGAKAKITKVEAFYETIEDGIKCYQIYVYGITDDGEKGALYVSIAEPLFGKTLNWTDDLTYHGSSWNWYTYMLLLAYDKESGDYVGEGYYYADNTDQNFKSGTLFVKITGNKITIKTSGVTDNDESFSIDYSGKCTISELTSEKVKAQKIKSNKN